MADTNSGLDNLLMMQRTMGGMNNANTDTDSVDIGPGSVFRAVLPSLENMGPGALWRPVNVLGAGMESPIMPINLMGRGAGLDCMGFGKLFRGVKWDGGLQDCASGVGGNVHSGESGHGSGPSGLTEASLSEVRVQETPIAQAPITAPSIG